MPYLFFKEQYNDLDRLIEIEQEENEEQNNLILETEQEENEDEQYNNLNFLIEPEQENEDEEDEEDEGETVCEDCGRNNRLYKTYACGDCQYDICCSKYVCIDHCLYKCPNGHENKVNNTCGWIYEQTCTICEIKWKPNFLWWGISLPEWIRRYY